ncbi:P-loop containing nucleoside triphosphate hydrolase [Phytophthora cactorum]|nr:P-loop containing nucleoside triphosphate hydrolase [Phytophthora cactorum]
MTCGAGYELLLCGASGTSKAMTVSTVAHDLKKRVLLVDFPSLQVSIVTSANLRDLFHEADISNAVLFVDEWRTSSCNMTAESLAIECAAYETYECIVFLATNRPFDLNEAVHRRITARVLVQGVRSHPTTEDLGRFVAVWRSED